MAGKQHNPHRDPAPEKPPLPEGYYEQWGGDFIWLLRSDGSVAGVFSDLGATEEAIATCAWQDASAREISASQPNGRF